MIEIDKKYKLPHSSNWKLKPEEHSFLVLRVTSKKKLTSNSYDYICYIEDRIGNGYDPQFFEIGKTINLVKALAEKNLIPAE